MPSQTTVVDQIDRAEVQDLSEKYGQPICRRYSIKTDPYLRTYRGRQDQSWRGEVVFAVRQMNGEILLHTKHRYERPIFRLPSGRIEQAESVEAALFREIAEETGQVVRVKRFLGVLDCHFVNEDSVVPFVSYIFYVESMTPELCPTDTEEVAGFKTVPARNLDAVAQSLRNLREKRRCWGYWRSLAHDLVYSSLNGP